MLISELPQPYKALAEKRRDEEVHDYYENNVLSSSFDWESTKEGHDWWKKCYYAQTESELPPYPYPYFINEKGDYFIDFGDGSAEIKASDFKPHTNE